jgi:hypothetical protein
MSRWCLYVENTDEETNTTVKYEVYKESLNVDVLDSFPDGILSLTFPILKCFFFRFEPVFAQKRLEHIFSYIYSQSPIIY